MTNNQRRCVAAAAAVLLSTVGPAAAEKKVRIIQTNSAGDNIHVIDPETNAVVGVITGIEVNTAPPLPRTAAVFTSATKRTARWTWSMRKR